MQANAAICFPAGLYIPLPDAKARRSFLETTLSKVFFNWMCKLITRVACMLQNGSDLHCLSPAELELIAQKTEGRLIVCSCSVLTQACAGYSGADLKALCTEAAFGPVRSYVSPCALRVIILLSSCRMGNLSNAGQVAMRPIALCDFENGLKQVQFRSFG